jgi:hypothetical protein
VAPWHWNTSSGKSEGVLQKKTQGFAQSLENPCLPSGYVKIAIENGDL